MRVPFRSEGEALNFLLLTVAAFAAIAAASFLGGVWLGVLVWGIVTVGAVFVYLRRGPPERRVMTAPAHVGPANERQVLVIANETLADVRLIQEIEGRRPAIASTCTSSARHRGGGRNR